MNIYRDFIQVFVNNQHARFTIMGFKKTHDWNMWAKSDDERYFKPYYWLLNICTHNFYSHEVYIDERPVKKNYGFRTIQFLINRTHRESWDLRFKKIKHIHVTDSKSCNLIQLADIILGSILFTPKSNSKVDIIKKLSSCTEKKFFGLVFTPYTKRKEPSQYKPKTYIDVRNTLKS